MILLDALYINNSGGKVLLDYLVQALYESGKDVTYLLDSRVKGDFDYLPKSKVNYLPNSLIKRHKFYKEHKNTFSSILCFGNIPPSVKLSGKVYTYMHNTVLFYCSDDFPIKVKTLYKIKSYIIRALQKNTDHWIVQTKEVVRLFEYYWKIPATNLKVLPFYREVNPDFKEGKRKKSLFLFVSDGHPNKMHPNLLKGFKIANKQCPDIKLILTVSKQYPELLKQIEVLNSENINVENVGWCGPEELKELYLTSGYLIFPSTSESFGLGLIEGAQNKMKILTSDLPFVHEVIQPSLTFDPLDPNSIAEAIIKSQKVEVPTAKLKVSNNINKIIELLN